MKLSEYYKLQKEFSDLIEKVGRKENYNHDELKVYERAVLACESVLSSYKEDDDTDTEWVTDENDNVWCAKCEETAPIDPDEYYGRSKVRYMMSPYCPWCGRKTGW